MRISRSRLSVGLIALLAVVVATQAVYLVRMHDRLDALTASPSSGPGISANPQAALPPSTPNPPKASGTPPWSRDSFFDEDRDPWPNTPFGDAAWNPFAELEHMRERMGRMFDQAFRRFDTNPLFEDFSREVPFAPDLDLRDEGDRYVVQVDVPGSQQASLKVEVKDQMLTVSGTREETQRGADASGYVMRRERRLGQFSRSVRLPGPVDANRIDTIYEDGILTITIPRLSIRGQV